MQRLRPEPCPSLIMEGEKQVFLLGHWAPQTHTPLLCANPVQPQPRLASIWATTTYTAAGLLCRHPTPNLCTCLSLHWLWHGSDRKQQPGCWEATGRGPRLWAKTPEEAAISGSPDWEVMGRLGGGPGKVGRGPRCFEASAPGVPLRVRKHHQRAVPGFPLAPSRATGQPLVIPGASLVQDEGLLIG